MDSLDVNELLNRARQGDVQALGQLLDYYRPYLSVLAQRHLDSEVRGRVDASDVVQLTYMEAFRDLPQFRGTHEAELVAWLRQILRNNLSQMLQRHVFAQRRSVDREKSLDNEGKAAEHLRNSLAGNLSSPSRRAMRGENAVLLAQALQALPEDQREAVRLRHLEGWTLAQLASHFGRSEVAVAGLLKRGLRALRKKLRDDT